MCVRALARFSGENTELSLPSKGVLDSKGPQIWLLGAIHLFHTLANGAQKGKRASPSPGSPVRFYTNALAFAF